MFYSAKPSHAAHTAQATRQPTPQLRRLLCHGLLIAAAGWVSMGLAQAQDIQDSQDSQDLQVSMVNPDIRDNQVNQVSMDSPSNPISAETPPLNAMENSAVNGHLADVTSTGVGLLMGAAEANPLGLLTLGAKAMAYKNIKESPAIEQPRLWSLYGAVGWALA